MSRDPVTIRLEAAKAYVDEIGEMDMRSTNKQLQALDELAEHVKQVQKKIEERFNAKRSKQTESYEPSSD